MPRLFPIRARILSAPTSKRLASLSCLELRREIQEASRKNLRMNLVWNQFMYEVCDRVSRYSSLPKTERADKFTPTDISLIFSAFSGLKRNNRRFYNHLLECVNLDAESYTVRDIAILYNSLSKLNIANEFVFDNLNKMLSSKLNSKVSEKDISLLLNGLLELRVGDVKDIFVKSALILSSRVKYITNPHTLTLLLHSYSRLSYTIEGQDPEVGGAGTEDVPKLWHLDEKRLEVNEYEHIILTDVTTSLLSKSTDLQLQMRATDLLYLYRSVLNLLFNTPQPKRSVHANLVKLYKIHNQIMQLKMEFQTRELISLHRLISDSYSAVSGIDFSQPQQVTDSGITGTFDEAIADTFEVAALEMYKNNPKLLKAIKHELAYRVRLMSLQDCLNFMRQLDPDDDTLEPLFSRMHNKLDRESTWEAYSTADLMFMVQKLLDRTVKHTSHSAKLLTQVIIDKTPRALKLKELTAMLHLSERLGVKSKYMAKKLATVECRADSLDEEQLFTLFHCSVSLGYLGVLDTLFGHLHKVVHPSRCATLLMDLLTLRLHSLRQVDPGLLSHLQSRMDPSDDTVPYISMLNKCTNTDLTGLGHSYNPKGAVSEGVDLEVGRHRRHYIDANFEHISYTHLVEDFTSELEAFIAQNDSESALKLRVEIGGFQFPAAVEIGSRKVGLVPLFDDFYTTKNGMLKLQKYTQLKLLEQLDIDYVCVDLLQYRREPDRTSFLATILRKSYEALSKSPKDRKNISEDVSNTRKERATNCNIPTHGINEARTNNFNRFRSKLSAHAESVP